LANLLLLASSGENFFRFIIALVIFVGVLAATYYVTQWVAGYQKVRMINSNFEVIDSMRISANKYMMIVRMGKNKYFSIGVGKDEFTLFGELSEDDIIDHNIETKPNSLRGNTKFSALFDAFSNHKETSEHHEEES
jgi:flagellar protein FliO/FliZ